MEETERVSTEKLDAPRHAIHGPWRWTPEGRTGFGVGRLSKAEKEDWRAQKVAAINEGRCECGICRRRGTPSTKLGAHVWCRAPMPSTVKAHGRRPPLQYLSEWAVWIMAPISL